MLNNNIDDKLVMILLGIIVCLATFRIVKFNASKSDLQLPPKFSYFFDLLRGKFDMKSHGPIKLIRSGYDKCGEIFRVRILHRHVTFVIGGPASSLVFASSDSEVSAKNVYGFMIPVFGKGVVYDATNEVMAQQLKWVFFGLGKKYFQTYCEKIFSEAKAYFDEYPEEGVRDVHQDMLELVSYTASRCLLGDEIRGKLTREAGMLLKDLSDGVSHLSIFFPRFPSETHKKRDMARAKISDIILKIIHDRKKNGTRKEDYLQHLMDSNYRDGSKPADESIAGLIVATLFGGQHTSSNVLTYMIMLVAKYKNTLGEKYENEQKEAFGENDKFTVEILEKMTFLGNTIKEVLRMYPPLIVLAREVLKPLVYGKYYVPEGDIIAVSPSVTHRLESIYKNPNIFDPDRFAMPRNEGNGRYEHQPFGGGKHICLGRHFAAIQIKIIFSILFQCFDFELQDKKWSPEIDYSHIIAGPFENNFIKFKRRPKSEILFGRFS